MVWASGRYVRSWASSCPLPAEILRCSTSQLDFEYRAHGNHTAMLVSINKFHTTHLLVQLDCHQYDLITQLRQFCQITMMIGRTKNVTGVEHDSVKTFANAELSILTYAPAMVITLQKMQNSASIRQCQPAGGACYHPMTCPGAKFMWMHPILISPIISLKT